MFQKEIKVYGYRWVVLIVFALIQFGFHTLWSTFLPITGDASAFYNVTPLAIGFLAMMFMIVYVFASLPCSWIISCYGIRKGVGLGVITMGIFGLLRGVFGENYTGVVICTVALSLAQPLIVNSITTVTARWFPVDERATATGIALLAQFIGIMAGMVITPFLAKAVGIKTTLLYYGGFVAVLCVLFILIYREHPPTRPSLTEEENEPLNMREGLKNIFKTHDAILILIIFSIGLAIFNTVSTWIEQILAPRGFTSIQAGSLGGVMMLGAILGCILLSIISDKTGKRKVFILTGMLVMIPCLLGITFFKTFSIILVVGGILGFFQLGLAPIIMEAAADISRPSTEATIQGVLLMFGQGLSVIMIFLTDFFRSKSGAMTPFLLVFTCMIVLNLIIASRLSETRIQEKKSSTI
ncbi:MAG: MFS transporter [Desulfobacula sp.]|uniref:MFS transporter n=1 Tax=Desulfobacula sp. TaxID=2593537 RepID=UPI0025C22041|nr:MFS transporter [Desulfobacula sp.]MCD4721003.1 MFS transporter [Desulfobacula sp.]